MNQKYRTQISWGPHGFYTIITLLSNVNTSVSTANDGQNQHWSGRYSSEILPYTMLSDIRAQRPPSEWWRLRPTKMGAKFVYWSYLRHSPFHAVSVAFVWNTTTGWVSPEYHVIFDKYISTVPYMEADTVPYNWGDLINHSSWMATSKDVDLADTRLNVESNMSVSDQL